MATNLLVVPHGTGETAPDPLGRMRHVKASASATREAYTLTETSLPPGLGAPPHVHVEHEEAFYVLDGRIVFTVEGEAVHAAPGDFILVPRGASHGFDIEGTEPARFLCIFSPPVTERERASLAEQVKKYKESAP